MKGRNTSEQRLVRRRREHTLRPSGKGERPHHVLLAVALACWWDGKDPGSLAPLRLKWG